MIWQSRPRTDFGSMAAIVCGTGPVCLLLHGVGLRSEAWAMQIDALAQTGYTVVAPDMAGHGESTSFSGSPGLSHYTRRLHDAIVQRQPDQRVLVAGHSMGALIALDLAIHHPDRVRGVAPLNAVFRRSPEAADAVRSRAAALSEGVLADPTGPVKRWFGDANSAEAIACRNWLENADRDGYAAAYRVFAAEDGPDDGALASLACPALFMTGALDPNSTPEMSQRMAAMVPNGRCHVVPDAAHMMPMTHADTLNRALMDFFAECP